MQTVVSTLKQKLAMLKEKKKNSIANGNKKIPNVDILKPKYDMPIKREK